MKKFLTTTVIGIGAFAASSAMAASVSQGTGYAIGANGYDLFSYTDLTNPVPPSEATFLRENGTLTAVDAITYRPNTGGFFAYKNEGNRVFSVDVNSGALTEVAVAMGTVADNPDMPPNNVGATVETTTRNIGFDFNNALDAARVVSKNDENLVFFPTPTRDPAEVIRANDLFYVSDDANAGKNPSIFANAYTNAVPQDQVNADTQVQYVLDSDLDIVATLGNNSGELRTLGQLLVDGSALDFSDVGGFDILSPASDDNLGLALLNVDGMSNLYSFELPGMAGDIEATFVSTFGRGFGSFTVAANDTMPSPAPVPLPASALLLAAGLGGFGALRKFRKH